jgi:hypothetical protein
LNALTKEIRHPGQGYLDGYLLPFKGERLERGHWGERIFAKRGLGSAENVQDQTHLLSNPSVVAKHQKFEVDRAYRYAASYDARTSETVSVSALTATTRSQKP